MTAFQIYYTRMLFKLPWGRAVGILVVVAAFTLLTGSCSIRSAVKQRYQVICRDRNSILQF